MAMTQTQKRRKIWPILAAAVGMVLVFAACGPKETQPPKTEPAAQSRPDKVENDPQQMQQENVPEDDVISTVYGELSYPGMWTDRVQHEIEENGADVKIHFTCTVDGAPIKLFTLCYGTVPDDAWELGTLASGDMVVPVSMQVHPIVPQEDWSEEMIIELGELQQSQNDLLMQLREDPDFTPS